MGSCQTYSTCDTSEQFDTMDTEPFQSSVINDITDIEQKINYAFNHVADKNELRIELSPRFSYDKIYLKHLPVEDLIQKKRSMMIELLEMENLAKKSMLQAKLNDQEARY